MGLDLILYKNTKPLEEMTLEEEQEVELAYGRKTWAIADFFHRRCEAIEGDWEYRMTKADWDDFMEAVGKLGDPEFRAKAEEIVDYEWNVPDEDWDEAHMDVYDEVSRWLDTALGVDWGYQLGMAWELAAVIRWYDADAEVQKAFEEGEELILIKSY